MSSLRRIVIAGLPAAGLTVLTSLALTGSPVSAVFGDQGARPAALATPCAETERTNCGYGATTPAGEAPTTATTVPTTIAPATTAPATTSPASTVPATTSPATADTAGDTPTRGSNGYGSVSPTGNTDTVPPGVSPTSATPTSATPTTPGVAATTPGGGVSAGHNLPVTGPPSGAVVSLGVLLVAAGAGSVWYTRRRRIA